MTNSEQLISKLRSLIDDIIKEYEISVKQALRLEDELHELAKELEATKRHLSGCDGQNCHACANPCEQYLERIR